MRTIATRNVATTAIEILTDVVDMPELMAWADLAVGAAGSTCWEMALMQLPAAVVVLAENQQQIADRLSHTGAVVSLGGADRLVAEEAARAIADLCRDRVARASQSEAGLRLLDGRGAERVTAVMRAFDEPFPAGKPALRPANIDDAMSLWRQTNHPSARRASIRSSDPIPLPEHIRWLKKRLNSPDACIFVLDFHGLLLGSVRYEHNEAAAVVSINVLPAFRRRGLGEWMIIETAAPACERFGVRRVRARVRQDNPASAAMFTKLGFDTVESGIVDGLPCYVFEQNAKSIPQREPRGTPPRD
ncbi:MAG: GNAT family N-acetyltransferase [Candidatus Nealsonbacteria bacterium]|nr:GNAT family N-acetyltransferase [Candidatus Nealsonbacteria bacterium]